jgi:hypothetical protein
MNINYFEEYKLDIKKLNYFQQYFEKYFNNRFIYGYGTEDILHMIGKYDPQGNWLDLGSGTSTLFWSIPMSRIYSINCSDISPEALKVLSDYIYSKKVPPCYREALKIFGKEEKDLDNMRERFSAFFVLDVFKDWPKYLDEKQYDLITEFGTFGLAPDSQSFTQCFGEPARHLKKDGYLIGANWIRNTITIEKDGINNRYLNTELVDKAAKKFNLKIMELKLINIHDPEYVGIVTFVLKK